MKEYLPSSWRGIAATYLSSVHVHTMLSRIALKLITDQQDTACTWKHTGRVMITRAHTPRPLHNISSQLSPQGQGAPGISEHIQDTWATTHLTPRLSHGDRRGTSGGTIWARASSTSRQLIASGSQDDVRTTPLHQDFGTTPACMARHLSCNPRVTPQSANHSRTANTIHVFRLTSTHAGEGYQNDVRTISLH